MKHSCPYCLGRAFCSDGGRHEFPETIVVGEEIVPTYEQVGSNLPWHPDAHCDKCGGQIDCLACGDQDPISPLQQLAETAE